MKYKCFWEKEDVKGGQQISKRVKLKPDGPLGQAGLKRLEDDGPYMIISRGFASKGEPEFCLINMATGETVLAYFMARAALAEYLTENSYEPIGDPAKTAACGGTISKEDIRR